VPAKKRAPKKTAPTGKRAPKRAAPRRKRAPKKTVSARGRAEELVRTLRAAGHEAYFVGGCVRDLVRGVEPGDYDIATGAPPELVRALFRRTVPVGAAFGVILVLSGKHRFEVTTFRREGPYSDGRRPDSVELADARADVLRRDFTVNGLLYDPETKEVTDLVGGREDLERRLIRTIGEPDERFSEDRLRLLRAVRFAANLGFRVEEQTLAAVRRRAAEITMVSAERIRDELVRTFTRPGARRGLELLEETGLLGIVLPEVAAGRGVAQPPEFPPEGDVLTHTASMLEEIEKIEKMTVTLAFGILLHDVGKPPTYEVADRIRFPRHASVGAEMAREVCRRLRLSREQTARIVRLVGEHMRFADVTEMRLATLKRFLAQDGFAELLELYRLDLTASHGRLEKYEFVRARLAEFSREELSPPPLLTGRDLIAMGHAPGPRFGEVLGALEEAQLEGRVRTREEAERLVGEKLGPPGEGEAGPAS